MLSREGDAESWQLQARDLGTLSAVSLGMNNTATQKPEIMTTAEIIWGQISASTKIACGAREALYSETGDAGDPRPFVMFRVCGRALRKIIVRLDPSDTYSVEFVAISRKTWDSEIIEDASFICADQLSETIYRMVNK